MFYSYLLSASALATVSLGALLYTVAAPGEWKVEGAQAPASADRGRDHLSTRYREQMKLTQETLRDFGYTPGLSDIGRAGNAGARTSTTRASFSPTTCQTST